MASYGSRPGGLAVSDATMLPCMESGSVGALPRGRVDRGIPAFSWVLSGRSVERYGRSDRGLDEGLGHGARDSVDRPPA